MAPYQHSLPVPMKLKCHIGARRESLYQSKVPRWGSGSLFLQPYRSNTRHRHAAVSSTACRSRGTPEADHRQRNCTRNSMSSTWQHRRRLDRGSIYRVDVCIDAQLDRFRHKQARQEHDREHGLQWNTRGYGQSCFNRVFVLISRLH